MRIRQMLTSGFVTIMVMNVVLLGLAMLPQDESTRGAALVGLKADAPALFTSGVAVEPTIFKRLWSCVKCGGGYAARQLLRKDKQWDWERRSCDRCAGRPEA